MLRTRDFFVMVSLIAFLVVAISATLVSSTGLNFSNFGTPAAVFLADTETTYQAYVPETHTASRSSRLAAMREKISQARGLFVEEVPVTEEIVATSSDIVAVEDQGELLCEGYRTGGVVWSASGIKFEEVEGARLVYRELVVSAVAVGASSTVTTAPNPAREVLAQLPVRSLPLATKACLSRDVIGISLSGGLIRNNEFIAYQTAGSEQLIGYALDGFPIYGVSNGGTDQCGGSIKNGQYRYQLSNNRDTLINCFSGTPISL